MFEWLFPNWSHPTFLTALVGAKTLLNTALTALVAESNSTTSRSTVVMAGLTVTSTVLTVLVLRENLGIGASYVEFLAQVAVLVLTGYTAHSKPSLRRRATLPVFLGIIALSLIMIPLYGEATVAP